LDIESDLRDIWTGKKAVNLLGMPERLFL